MTGIWFRRLFASPLRPAGQPNFKSAPWRTFDLSGTKLTIKSPPQTMAVPRKIWPDSLDIYTPERFQPWSDKSKGSTALLFRNHWSYFDALWGKGHIGGTSVQIIVQRLTLQYTGIGSLFDTREAMKVASQKVLVNQSTNFLKPLIAKDNVL
ncbi:MAG: hypothetical protein ACR2PX_20665 [Endozoicomonas sp.]|uniref:hypothetical protein n=1 Tax=Endozoicomonas sp. TaxID=1892382 RepID=UPI003D9AC3B5